MAFDYEAAKAQFGVGRAREMEREARGGGGGGGMEVAPSIASKMQGGGFTGMGSMPTSLAAAIQQPPPAAAPSGTINNPPEAIADFAAKVKAQQGPGIQWGSMTPAGPPGSPMAAAGSPMGAGPLGPALKSALPPPTTPAGPFGAVATMQPSIAQAIRPPAPSLAAAMRPPAPRPAPMGGGGGRGYSF